MSEDEAKEEQCIGPDNCGASADIWAGRRCIGSACGMGWRWDLIATGWESEINSPSTSRVTHWGKSTTDGYCGLAGKP